MVLKCASEVYPKKIKQFNSWTTVIIPITSLRLMVSFRETQNCCTKGSDIRNFVAIYTIACNWNQLLLRLVLRKESLPKDWGSAWISGRYQIFCVQEVVEIEEWEYLKVSKNKEIRKKVYIY